MPIILILVLSIVFFVVDLMIPLGVAGGVPHVVSVLFSYKLKDRKAIPFFAILGSVLTIFAFFLSPPGGELWKVIANRFLALFVIWAVAIACMKIKSEKAKLHVMTTAINQSPNPIAITDIDAKIEYVNPAFLQKTGYSEKELLGNNPRILKSGKHSEDYYQVLWDTITSGNTWKENIFNKRKNGTLYWESLQITPLKNAQGEITHFYSLRLLDKQMEAVNKDLNTLSHTLDQVSQAVLMTDREGFIVYANPSFEKVTGYSLNEVLGMNPNVLKSGKQTPAFYEKLWETITTGESWRGELFNKKKNGEKYWERAVISPVYDDGNNISHFIAFRDDITEEKQKTEKLNKLSHIVEESPISILVTDSSGTIEYANRSLLETSGYSLDEVIGGNANMFKSGESPEKHYENLWNRITAGHDWRGTFHNKRKNGELYWESVLITSVINEEGNVINYVALKENISEKKQLESTLIDHERLIRSVVNNLNDGLIIANVDGNIQLFNHGAEKIFGCKAEEVMDKPVAVLMDESYKEKHDVGFARFQKTHKISPNNTSMEVVGTKKDGTPVPIELTLTQMEQRGELLVIGLVRDISERKEAEKKMNLAQKQLVAAQKLAGVGELAAGVSHEVLNPVNIISVHTQMLQRKTKDDANIQNFCIKVMHEIDRIQKIMGSLLAFSRKGDTELQKGSVKEEIEKTLSLVEEEYKLDNIKIVRDWCSNPKEVLFDADKIRQVFLNFLNNAKHAMPEGGTITVGCALTNREGKSYQQFTFSDTGTGMSEEVMLKIFEPFFTTKPEGEGTGMGMSVIHGIIREHDGKIRVESEEGKGTTFTISLPVA